jgi:hypothetical protein
MERRTVFQASAFAALLALVCAVLMGFVFRAPDPDVSLQPSYPVGTVDDFIRPVDEYPDLMLRLFATDSVFVLSYLMVFVGMHATVVDRARTFAWVGLGAGILTALLDATENAYFVTYAQASLSGAPLADPDLPAIYVVANLKWMAAFAALTAFGLVWPRSDRLGWLISALLLLIVLAGVLGVALPELFIVRMLFFLAGLPFLFWHFWRQARS